MLVAEILRVASRALLRNRSRSLLTALGVVIGVAAVIAMVAIGEGARANVERAFAAMGTQLLVVQSGSTAAGGAHIGAGSMPSLTWDDLKAINSQLSAVSAAAPVLKSGQLVSSEAANWGTSVQGTSPDYFALRSWKAAQGALFTESDADSGAKVALLGATAADNLFGPSSDPVGQLIRIRGVPFQVLGVLEHKGQSASGQDYDDVVLVPVRAYLAKVQGGLHKYLAGSIFVGAAGPGQTSRAQAQVASLLRDRHHLGPADPDDFSIRNLSEVADARQAGARTLTALLASIAAVSLLVGGIGIMNIMLVSVSERTREIGVRMAVGARPRDILAQFLAEALALSLAGGLLGVALGLVAADRLAAAFDWPLLVRPQVVLLAIGFSALVGVTFGLYPARKASRLDPIEALRYE